MKKSLVLVIIGFLGTACVPAESESAPSAGAKHLYVSATGCTVGVSSVNYSGYDAGTCAYYHEAALSARCTKILWLCN